MKRNIPQAFHKIFFFCFVVFVSAFLPDTFTCVIQSFFSLSLLFLFLSLLPFSEHNKKKRRKCDVIHVSIAQVMKRRTRSTEEEQKNEREKKKVWQRIFVYMDRKIVGTCACAYLHLHRLTPIKRRFANFNLKRARFTVFFFFFFLFLCCSLLSHSLQNIFSLFVLLPQIRFSLFFFFVCMFILLFIRWDLGLNEKKIEKKTL